MSDQVEYQVGILHLPKEIQETWHTICRHYEERGEILIACISVTVENEEPSIEFLANDAIKTASDILNALDALAYAVDRVRSRIFS